MAAVCAGPAMLDLTDLGFHGGIGDGESRARRASSRAAYRDGTSRFSTARAWCPRVSGITLDVSRPTRSGGRLRALVRPRDRDHVVETRSYLKGRRLTSCVHAGNFKARDDGAVSVASETAPR